MHLDLPRVNKRGEAGMVNCVVAGDGDLFLKCLRWASAEEARGLLARLNLSGVPKYFLVSSAKDTNLVFLAKV